MEFVCRAAVCVFLCEHIWMRRVLLRTCEQDICACASVGGRQGLCPQASDRNAQWHIRAFVDKLCVEQLKEEIQWML